MAQSENTVYSFGMEIDLSTAIAAMQIDHTSPAPPATSVPSAPKRPVPTSRIPIGHVPAYSRRLQF